jgi:hypothetical protein
MVYKAIAYLYFVQLLTEAGEVEPFRRDFSQVNVCLPHNDESSLPGEDHIGRCSTEKEFANKYSIGIPHLSATF